MLEIPSPSTSSAFFISSNMTLDGQNDPGLDLSELNMTHRGSYYSKYITVHTVLTYASSLTVVACDCRKSDIYNKCDL